MRQLSILTGWSLLWPALLLGQARVPDAALDVTVRQRHQGQLGRAFHVLELRCFAGRCSLTKITLNQCLESGEGKLAFHPKVERSSTSEGNLVVKNEGRTLIVREVGADLGGDYVSNFRFEYAVPQKGPATELLNFTGGFVKNSAILGEVITAEYVPLPKAFQVVTLDLRCVAAWPWALIGERRCHSVYNPVVLAPMTSGVVSDPSERRHLLVLVSNENWGLAIDSGFP